jgi:hypothetical protein
MLSSEVALGLATAIVTALWATVGLLFKALLAAKDAQIADAKEGEASWRTLALSGTSLAKDVVEALPPPRRAR